MNTVSKSAERVAHIFAVRHRIAKNGYFVSKKALVDAQEICEHLKSLAMEMSEVADCDDTKSLSAHLELSQRFVKLLGQKHSELTIAELALEHAQISWLNAERQNDLAVRRYGLLKISEEQAKDEMMAWRGVSRSFCKNEVIL